MTKIKSKKTFFCSDIKKHLSPGAVAEVSDAYAKQAVKGGLAEIVLKSEKKTKEEKVFVAEPKKEAKAMTSQSKSTKKK